MFVDVSTNNATFTFQFNIVCLSTQSIFVKWALCCETKNKHEKSIVFLLLLSVSFCFVKRCSRLVFRIRYVVNQIETNFNTAVDMIFFRIEMKVIIVYGNSHFHKLFFILQHVLHFDWKAIGFDLSELRSQLHRVAYILMLFFMCTIVYIDTFLIHMRSTLSLTNTNYHFCQMLKRFIKI